MGMGCGGVTVTRVFIGTRLVGRVLKVSSKVYEFCEWDRGVLT